MPAITAISAGKDLTGVSANVDATGIERIRTHTMTQHAQAHSRTGGQPFVKRLPLLTCVLCAVNSKLFVYIVAPIGIFDDDEHGIRVVGIKRDRKTEFGGQIVLNIYPIIASVEAFVDAAMVLL